MITHLVTSRARPRFWISSWPNSFSFTPFFKYADLGSNGDYVLGPNASMEYLFLVKLFISKELLKVRIVFFDSIFSDTHINETVNPRMLCKKSLTQNDRHIRVVQVKTGHSEQLSSSEHCWFRSQSSVSPVLCHWAQPVSPYALHLWPAIFLHSSSNGWHEQPIYFSLDFLFFRVLQLSCDIWCCNYFITHYH